MASGVVPLGVGILAEIGDLLVGDVAVGEEIGDVLVLWSVGGVKLVGVEFEPFEELVCRCKSVKVRWRSPTVEWATEDCCGGILRGVCVGVFSVGA